jgi:hypothetical protein
VLGRRARACAIWRFGVTPQGIAACGLLWSLLALTMIDFDTQLLPDGITLPLLWAGLIVNLWSTFAPLSDAVIGAAAGYLSLWAVYWAFKLIRGKEGMGVWRFQAARSARCLARLAGVAGDRAALVGGRRMHRNDAHRIQGPRPLGSDGFRPVSRDRRAIALFFGADARQDLLPLSPVPRARDRTHTGSLYA